MRLRVCLKYIINDMMEDFTAVSAHHMNRFQVKSYTYVESYFSKSYPGQLVPIPTRTKLGCAKDWRK